MSYVARSREIPSLEQLARQTLISYRSALSNIGDIELVLVGPVLQLCSAEDLARIEDSTERYGRKVAWELRPYWRRAYEAVYGELSPEEAAKLLPDASTDSSLNTGINWRLLYDWKSEQRAEKMRRTGAMLREMQRQEESSRNAHTVQVINRPENRHTPPKSHWSAGRSALPKTAGKPKGAQQLIAMKHKAAAAASKTRSPGYAAPLKSSWQQAKLASIDRSGAVSSATTSEKDPPSLIKRQMETIHRLKVAEAQHQGRPSGQRAAPRVQAKPAVLPQASDIDW
ncbi:hypothetical protein WJX84_010936 [Apatococcus fuscideae]|uniref:Uncharacterized protein n=1 Tax=Apatococcus fuscideae TaxID=2026836 RepID=A0AAW1SP08_9CHLO